MMTIEEAKELIDPLCWICSALGYACRGMKHRESKCKNTFDFDLSNLSDDKYFEAALSHLSKIDYE